MAEYLCLTLLADPTEGEAGFKARLAAFWTHILRNRRDDYEKVYAEATTFGAHEGRISRQYMVEEVAIDALLEELTAHRIAHLTVDRDETYSKYEAVSPDWFQIEH
jgi:hypothetical protein